MNRESILPLVATTLVLGVLAGCGNDPVPVDPNRPIPTPIPIPTPALSGLVHRFGQ